MFVTLSARCSSSIIDYIILQIRGFSMYLYSFKV